jgi:hypothetical protein
MKTFVTLAVVLTVVLGFSMTHNVVWGFDRFPDDYGFAPDWAGSQITDQQWNEGRAIFQSNFPPGVPRPTLEPSILNDFTFVGPSGGNALSWGVPPGGPTTGDSDTDGQ